MTGDEQMSDEDDLLETFRGQTRLLHLEWMEKVVCDRSMHGLPAMVAMLLGIYCIKNGEGWPSVGELATKLHTDHSNVQLAIDRLVEAGWLIDDMTIYHRLSINNA